MKDYYKILEVNNTASEEVITKVYRTLAKKYLEEYNPAKFWTIENVPEYLHGVDRAADELWDVMHEKLSHDPRYKHTGNYLEDVRRENVIKQLIEEEILNEIVYV